MSITIVENEYVELRIDGVILMFRHMERPEWDCVGYELPLFPGLELLHRRGEWAVNFSDEHGDEHTFCDYGPAEDLEKCKFLRSLSYLMQATVRATVAMVEERW